MVSSSSKALLPTAFALRAKRARLSIGEADAPSSEAVPEQSVLDLKEFDDDELMAMDPASSNHQQK